MSLALYRKYRPAMFAEVVGQEHVTEPLSTALAAGRINHAYLFSGPRGCGKTSSARILARSLNCEQGPTAERSTIAMTATTASPRSASTTRLRFEEPAATSGRGGTSGVPIGLPTLRLHASHGRLDVGVRQWSPEPARGRASAHLVEELA